MQCGLCLFVHNLAHLVLSGSYTASCSVDNSSLDTPALQKVGYTYVRPVFMKNIGTDFSIE